MKMMYEGNNPFQNEEKKEPITLFFTDMEQEAIHMYMNMVGANSYEEAIMKAILK